jgi:hypothetical protein
MGLWGTGKDMQEWMETDPSPTGGPQILTELTLASHTRPREENTRFSYSVSILDYKL